jgi:hypothetical protein
MMKKQGRPIVLTKSEKIFLNGLSQEHHRLWHAVVCKGRRGAMVKGMIRRGLVETREDSLGTQCFRLLPKGRSVLVD